MKILLLGEFSGLHKNLKEGLLELGHEVTIAANGDGFKSIASDIVFSKHKSGFLSKFENRISPFLLMDKLSNYDIVQLINPFMFYFKYFPTNLFYDKLIRNNNKFYILAAGDDAYFWKYGRKRLAYGPFDDFLKYDLKSSNYFLATEKAYEFNSLIVNKSRGIIPIMYEYEVSYQMHSKRLNTIPIPINLKLINSTVNTPKEKLVIFHGLNRYGFKGTRHVEEAFSYLSGKYPNDLELIIDGKMPLNQYLELMRKTNVVIDQMYSHSLGVNGVYALAMGKVVMGGAEPESLLSLGVTSSPVINLKPTSQCIIENVEKLLEYRTSIEDMGYKSRLFAEANHDHIKVAEQYINTWRGN